MSSTDLMVYSGLAVVAAYPFAAKAAASLWHRVTAPTPPSKPGKEDSESVEAWRQKWSSVLISLNEDVETGHGQLQDPDKAIRLSRELIWEIIGGDSPQASSKK